MEKEGRKEGKLKQLFLSKCGEDSLRREREWGVESNEWKTAYTSLKAKKNDGGVGLITSKLVLYFSLVNGRANIEKSG